jgi:pimeloyl-ACP methyl ester carboxylesterase
MTLAKQTRIIDILIALLALAAIAVSLWNLRAATEGVDRSYATVGSTPVTVYRPTQGGAAPVVLIAHGFAGSQQLMQSFALAFARNGYVAVSFDFAGHGRNPQPMTGNITREDGATRSLLVETQAVAAYARGLGDGRLAVLGHSMASDIIVRFAQAAPDVAATIAVSMFSPVVTATTPRNLLVITGEWEGMLKREALRAVGLAIVPQTAEAGITYGDPAAGSGRRAAVSPHVEHASVLFSQAGLREAVDWLDLTFGIARTAPAVIDARGPWIALLIAGTVLLARPLSRYLPRIAKPATGANLDWRRLWLPLLLPMIVTPLILRVVPTHFLPVLVGDYLAVHFGTYGLLTALCLFWVLRGTEFRLNGAVRLILLATAAVTAYSFIAIAWPVDSFVTSFVPAPGRIVLALVMLAGTLPYFAADEWMTRGQAAARGAYAASKLAFLASLSIAIGLDFERLFFLVIIVPVIVLFFAVYGLFSRWAYRATGHPLVDAIANAIAFAWAIGVTFPLLAG